MFTKQKPPSDSHKHLPSLKSPQEEQSDPFAESGRAGRNVLRNLSASCLSSAAQVPG